VYGHGFARCDYATVNGKDRVEEWMKFHSPLDGLVGSGKGGRNGKLAESTKVIGMEIWWRVENVVETDSRRRVGKLVETESRQRVGTVVRRTSDGEWERWYGRKSGGDWERW